ncbi:MAG: efflux RND transporter periplasmic adaptor subunit [Chloroflexota bacterium]
MKFLKKRSNLVIAAIVLAAIIGGVWYFTQAPSADATAAPALQTTKVRTGDLVITASGAGTVMPAAQVEMGFRSPGVLAELNVKIGDRVTAGQVLARLDDSTAQRNLEAAQREYLELTSPTAIIAAKQQVAVAEDELEAARSTLAWLISPSVLTWEERVTAAETALQKAKDANAPADEIQKLEQELKFAQANLTYARNAYYDYLLENFVETETIQTRSGEVTVIVKDENGDPIINYPSEQDIALARYTYELAQARLQEARWYLAALQGEEIPENASGAKLAALEKARLNLEDARLALESTRLTAPFDGTVTSLNAVVGQTVGTSPILSLETMHDLLVRFYLDETDVSKAIVGRPVVFTFDAYPDETVTGEIVLVEPALQIVDGTPVVVVWAKLTDKTDVVILSGMTVEAEVIAAESRGTLLVPVQALRELAPGSYAVFVVQPDGSLKMTPVTVGLRDYANAEILSGLKVGDVVSTGTVETK